MYVATGHSSYSMWDYYDTSPLMRDDVFTLSHASTEDKKRGQEYENNVKELEVWIKTNWQREKEAHISNHISSTTQTWVHHLFKL